MKRNRILNKIEKMLKLKEIIHPDETIELYNRKIKNCQNLDLFISLYYGYKYFKIVD